MNKRISYKEMIGSKLLSDFDEGKRSLDAELIRELRLNREHEAAAELLRQHQEKLLLEREENRKISLRQFRYEKGLCGTCEKTLTNNKKNCGDCLRKGRIRYSLRREKIE